MCQDVQSNFEVVQLSDFTSRRKEDSFLHYSGSQLLYPREAYTLLQIVPTRHLNKTRIQSFKVLHQVSPHSISSTPFGFRPLKETSWRIHLLLYVGGNRLIRLKVQAMPTSKCYTEYSVSCSVQSSSRGGQGKVMLCPYIGVRVTTGWQSCRYGGTSRR